MYPARGGLQFKPLEHGRSR